ncbi:helix-turn-helix domain-containing protein [Streptosporangium sp. NPDC002544]|uniref:TetR/AcrR family transcriptional regulator n=1 Tax=Streptosporangium sp. NPDC002544 TaxID=3154538 RepID=UPI003325196B
MVGDSCSPDAGGACLSCHLRQADKPTKKGTDGVGGQTPRNTPGRPAGSDGAATRHRIMRAAMQHVAERGYSGATVRAIAESAGVTVGSLFHHGGSRPVGIRRGCRAVARADPRSGEEADGIRPRGCRLARGQRRSHAGVPPSGRLRHSPGRISDQDVEARDLHLHVIERQRQVLLAATSWTKNPPRSRWYPN